MARKKKSGDKSETLQTIALITTILNLVRTLIEIIKDLLE